MSKFDELLDSLNEDNIADVREQLKAEAKVKDTSNTQLYSRAKKAEGFELKDGKWIKKEQTPEPKPSNPEAKKSDEPDYGKLAYLKAEGVSHPDDRKVVMEEAKRLQLPIEEVLGMEHIKGRLKDAKNQREAEGGMPEGGSGKTSGNKTSVDYWVDKKDKDGNYITPDDTKLANEVIDARLKQTSENNMFSDVLHN